MLGLRYLSSSLRRPRYVSSLRNMSQAPNDNSPAIAKSSINADERDPNSKSAGKKTISSCSPQAANHTAAKREAKRLEKEAKLAAKAVKGPAAPAGEKKAKIEKEKKEEEAPFVNTTPKGEKKGEY